MITLAPLVYLVSAPLWRTLIMLSADSINRKVSATAVNYEVDGLVKATCGVSSTVVQLQGLGPSRYTPE